MNTHQTYQNRQAVMDIQQTYFRIHRIEENIRPPEWQIERVDRPYTVFWYVAAGTKIIKINGVEFKVKENDLVVFPSQVPFEILKTSSNETLHHIEIAVEIKLGPFDFMSLYKFPVLTKLANDSDQAALLLNLWKQLQKDWSSYNRNPISSKDGEIKFRMGQTFDLLAFNALTLQWLKTALSILQPYAQELFPAVDSRFQHLFYYINDHLSEKITLKKLAEEVYLSESHLSLLFRQNVKMSPMEYVRMERMRKVRELLLTTSLPLKDIADQVGFKDQSQLSRAFRQTVGVSPAEYRRKGDFI